MVTDATARQEKDANSRDGHKNHIAPDVREVERSLGEEMDYFLDFEIFFTLPK